MSNGNIDNLIVMIDESFPNSDKTAYTSNKDIEEVENKINDYIHKQINKNDKIPYNNKPFPKPIKKFMLKLLGLIK